MNLSEKHGMPYKHWFSYFSLIYFSCALILLHLLAHLLSQHTYGGQKTTGRRWSVPPRGGPRDWTSSSGLTSALTHWAISLASFCLFLKINFIFIYVWRVSLHVDLEAVWLPDMRAGSWVQVLWNEGQSVLGSAGLLCSSPGPLLKPFFLSSKAL